MAFSAQLLPASDQTPVPPYLLPATDPGPLSALLPLDPGFCVQAMFQQAQVPMPHCTVPATSPFDIAPTSLVPGARPLDAELDDVSAGVPFRGILIWGI